jgi:GTPase Era involved in 16S rRNA processing
MDQPGLEEKLLHLYRKLEQRNLSRAREHLRGEIRSCERMLGEAHAAIRRTPNYEKAAMLKAFNERTLQVSMEIRQLAEGLEQPFMLFIMGMGKYGKSTLLNALLEQKAADVDILPKTWKIDVFEGRDDSQAVVRFSDGTIRSMNVSECRAFLDEEERKRAESEKTVRELFRAQSSHLGSIEEKEELRKFLYDKMLYKSKVVEVRWPVKPNRLLEHFRLVDTPGLVQNLIGEVQVGIQEYYHKADGVIWLLDATAISAQQSRKLLDELNESMKQIGGRTSNIIAVLNFIDRVRKNGGEEAVSDVIREARRLFGDLFREIIPISAKEAVDGMETGNEEWIERSGIRELLRVIQTRFYAQAQMIQAESKRAGLRNICRVYRDELETYASRLAKDAEDYDGRSKAFEKACREIRQTIEERKRRFFEKYADRVSGNIERYAERLFDISDMDSQRQFIQSAIFETDHVHSELGKLKKKYDRMLQDFFRYHASKAVFKEYPRLPVEQMSLAVQGQAGLQVEASVDADTSGISFVSGAGMFFAGALLLGPIGLVLAGLASAFGFTRWLARKMKLGSVKRDLRTALDDFMAKIDGEILNAVNPRLTSIGEQVYGIMNDTYSAIHGDPDSAKEILETIGRVSEKMVNPVSKLSVKELLTA